MALASFTGLLLHTGAELAGTTEMVVSSKMAEVVSSWLPARSVITAPAFTRSCSVPVESALKRTR